MVILDSNIIIYLYNETLDTSIITDVPVGYASISRLETLGFQNIRVSEEQLIRNFLRIANQFPLTDAIIDRAIILKQTRKMGLPDAIIAATALENDCELWTANTEDFAGIEDLRLRNPLTA